MLTALTVAAKLVICGVFVWASVAKLGDLRGFRRSLEGFGLSGTLGTAVGVLVPIAETIVGVLLWMPAFALGGAIAASVLLGCFAVVLSSHLLRGRRPVCYCFGELLSRHIRWSDVARNVSLLAVAGFIAWQMWLDSEAGAGAWLAGATVSTQMTLVGATAVVLGVSASVVSARLPRRGRSDTPPLDSPGGLPIGEAAPDVQFFDGTGREISRDVLRRRDHRPTAIVFLSDTCRSCRLMKQPLGEWQRQHSSKVALFMVLPWADASQPQSGDALEPAVVFQRDRAATTAFRAFIIPCAVRIDSRGAIDSPLAMGKTAVWTLLSQTLSASKDADAPQPGRNESELTPNAG